MNELTGVNLSLKIRCEDVEDIFSSYLNALLWNVLILIVNVASQMTRKVTVRRKMNMHMQVFIF